MEDMRFQQDSAIPYIAKKNNSIFEKKINNLVIISNGNLNRPTISYDVTVLDYFLRGT